MIMEFTSDGPLNSEEHITVTEIKELRKVLETGVRLVGTRRKSLSRMGPTRNEIDKWIVLAGNVLAKTEWAK